MEIANLNGSSMLLSGMILQVPFGSKKRVQAAIQLSLALGMSGHPASHVTSKDFSLQGGPLRAYDRCKWGEMGPFKILWSYKLVTGVLSSYFSLEPKLNGAPAVLLGSSALFWGVDLQK